MWSLTRLRQCGLFDKSFALVHPLCWPILWWELNRLIRWFESEKPEDILYEVNSWGFVTVRYIAPRIDPTLYKPLPRTFRPLTDPGYASALPVAAGTLASHDTFEVCAILARPAGAASQTATQGASALNTLDTS